MPEGDSVLRIEGFTVTVAAVADAMPPAPEQVSV
jgi:hypothetical protein